MTKQLKGIKLRLYPNKSQEKDLRQMCGNSRFVWNLLYDIQLKRYENNKDLYEDSSDEAKLKRSHVTMSAYAMNYLLPQLKKEYPFLKLSGASALQVVSGQLYQAYQNFFKNPKHFGLPNFKSLKTSRLSYTSCSSRIKIAARRYIRLPKIGYIKVSKTDRLQDVKIKRYTVECDSTDRWYISFQVEFEPAELAKTGKTVGIDVGLTDLAVYSDGFKSGRFIEKDLTDKIERSQSVYSKRRHYAKVKIAMDNRNKVINPRTMSDFSNVEKARVTKAKLQKHLANKRKDFLHKLTTDLVRNYDVIVIEDIKAKNMMRNSSLAKSIANAAWREFRIMLEYKCRWYGKQLIAVSPNYTSQECSNCHHIDGKKTLDIREWTCSKCNTHHDRDINAAQNILNRGLATLN